MTAAERRDARRLEPTGHPGIYRKQNRFVVVWRHRGRQRKRSFRTLTEARRFKAQTMAGETAPTSIERVIVPYFSREMPTLKLDELGPADLRDFIAHLADAGHAPATVRRYVAPLRAMLATAYEDGRIARNPAAGVRVVVPGERTPKV